MTNLRKTAEQALEALEKDWDGCANTGKGEAITALRAALAEPDVPEANFGNMEPVAWYLPCPEGVDDSIFRDHRTIAACTGNNWTGFMPLYTAPPQRKPLTDEEIYQAIKGVDSLKAVEVARAIEAAHGITGGSDE